MFDTDSVTLCWTNPPTTKAITGYQVQYRRLPATSSDQWPNQITNDGGNATQQIITGLSQQCQCMCSLYTIIFMIVHYTYLVDYTFLPFTRIHPYLYLSGLAVDATYEFRVRLRFGSDFGGFSSTVNITTGQSELYT